MTHYWKILSREAPQQSFFLEKKILFFSGACEAFSDSPEVCEKPETPQAVKDQAKEKRSALQEKCPAVLSPHEKKQEFLEFKKKYPDQLKPGNSEFEGLYKENINILTNDISDLKRNILNDYNAQKDPDIRIFEEWVKQAPQTDKIKYARQMLYQTVFYADENGTLNAEKISNALSKMEAQGSTYNQELSESLPFMKIYSAFFCDDPSISVLDKKNMKDYGKKKAFYAPLYEEDLDENGNNVIFANSKNLAGILENLKENTIVKLTKGNYEGPFLCTTDGVTIQPDESAPSGSVKIKGSGEGNALTLAGNNSKICGEAGNKIRFETSGMSVALQMRGENCSAKNCDFDGIQTGILSLESNAHISQCRFNNCTKDGILFCGDNTTVEDNDFENYAGKDNAHNDWIQMFKGTEKVVNGKKQYFHDRFSDTGTISGVKISKNRLSINNPGNIEKLQGITLFQASIANSEISGNQINVGSVHGITLKGNGNTITGNFLVNKNSKINVSGKDNTVSGNFYGNPNDQDFNTKKQVAEKNDYKSIALPEKRIMDAAQTFLPAPPKQTRFELPEEPLHHSATEE